jgi:hypothetical protein
LNGLEEEFELLKMQAKAFALSRRMADIGFIRDITKFRSEGDDIYAFKPQLERFLRWRSNQPF